MALGAIPLNIPYAEPVNVFASPGPDDLIVTVVGGNSISASMLSYNGNSIGREGYIEFEGVMYPAFCVDTTLLSADWHPNGQYPVSISGTNMSPMVATVLHNSVPYVTKDSIEGLFPGLNDLQIYAATKAAIRAVSDESSALYPDDNLWTGDPQTVAFTKHLINLAKNNTGPMPEVAIYGYTDYTDAVLDGDYYVATLKVQSTNYALKDGTKIKLTLPQSAPSGTIITDVSDNPIPATGVDNFTDIKIKVPQSSVTVGTPVTFDVKAELTIASGVVLFGLPTQPADQGVYQRYEIAMPHQPAMYSIPFDVVPFNDTPTPTPEPTPPPEPGDNPDEPGELEIRKFEAGTTSPLAGAEFRVTHATGGVVGYFTTDSSGTVSVKDLRPGAYYIEEVTPPAGFALDEYYHKDVVVISEQTTTVTFHNERLPSLEITKIDGNSGATLAGAVFRVALDGGSDFFDVTTDASGKASLDNLEPGTWTVTELTPPPGYVLNATVEMIKIEPGKAATLIFSNWTKPGIIIKKYDEMTAERLPGAEFSVAHKGGNIVYEGVTDSNGMIVVEGLSPGWYTITELAPPQGYLIATPYKDVYLEAGQTVEVKFDNRKRPSLSIMKIDGQTGEPLAGAIFHVRKTEDSLVSEYITDETGMITIHDLDEAIYTVTEIKAPEGYILDPQTQTVMLEWGTHKTLIFENWLRPKLEIIKRDAVTGEPLANTRFTVSKAQDATVSEFITDGTGRILIEDLDVAIYIVKETHPPEGWMLDPNPRKEILLEAGTTKTLIFDNTRLPTLIIRKINQLTFAPIPNATFRVELERPNGGVFHIGTFRTNENGEIILPKVPSGWYTITETVPPPGFSLPSNPVTRIFLNPGENAYEPSTNQFYPNDGSSSSSNLTVSSGNDFVNGTEVGDYPLNSIVIKKNCAVTGELLHGAAFEVRKISEMISGSSGTLIGRYTTDNSGIIVITGVEPGGYIVTEVQAPPNYMLSETSQQQLWMRYDGTSIEEITFSNIPYGNLLVTKVDAVTSAPLGGARFKVTDGTGALAGSDSEYVTDIAGQFLVSNLKPGTYIVSEIEAPHGYVTDTQPQTVHIGQDGKTYTVSFRNQPIGGLLITKRCSVTMAPLSGAHFQITDSHGAFVGDAANGLHVTDAKGTIFIGDILPGAYIITEVKAPDGYIADMNTQTVHIEYGMVKHADFYNTPLGGLLIKKYDAVTREPLAEAIFRVTDIQGAVVGTSDGLFRTDPAGTIYIYGLPPGGYYVQEIQAPDGYILDNVAQTIQILDERMYSLEFFNQPVNEFVIMKYDAITMEPLPGATVRVEKLGATTELIGEFTTDPSGRINVPGLLPGSYSVQEIQAPPGYLLDNTVHIVNLQQNRGMVVSLYNYPLGGLLIRKFDSQSMQPLPGAVFSVRRQDGTLIGETTTNHLGFAMYPQLNPGFYVIEELRAPDGYITDGNVQTVEVKAHDMALATFFNHPMSGLTINKFDADNRQPLSGARFRISRMNGEVIGEYTTDVNGQIRLTDLSPGWYTAVEFAAPPGYQLSNASQDFEITHTRTVTLEFPNERLASLVIKKIDNDTGAPLIRAKFIVELIDGTHVGEFTTDADGLINIPHAAPGWYIIREVQAPDGYLLDEDPKTVEVKTNVPTVVTFSNKRLASLVILKIDEVSGEPLAGAKFAIERQNGERIGEYTSDGTGHINVPSLDPDWYVVRETRAPEGYLLDETPKIIEVKTSAPTVVTFTNKPLTGLQIIKIDADTGAPLGGARFAVEKQNGERVGEWTTDNTGFINIPTLDPDWYVVREVMAPPGYLLDEAPKTVEVKTNAPTVVTFVNKLLTGIHIIKTDESNGAPLAGAKFTVERANGERIGEYTTDAAGSIIVPNLDPDWYIVKETFAPDGYLLDEAPRTVEVKSNAPTVITFTNKRLTGLQIIKIDEHTGTPLAGARFSVEKQNGERVGEYTTDGAGIINIPLLDPDWYVVKETRAPDGYFLDETPRVVEVKTAAPTVITFTNKRLTSLQIIKIDADTGEPLGGARFAVENINGERVGEWSTDNTGFINIETLTPDWYTIREVMAPPGYLLDETPRTVEVKTNAPTVETFVNKMLTALHIIKIDEHTGEPLAGARFTVEKQSGERVGEYTTDAAGSIIVPMLDPDWYVVRETRAPDGYFLDEAPRTVQVTSAAPTVVTFTNKRLTSLQIRKEDSDTGEPLGGARFAVERLNGERVGDWTTDSTGFINITTLLPDWYIIRETQAPPGYLLDETPRTVEVKTNAPTVETFVNKKLTALQIIKIDETTRNPLPGAVFTVEKQNGERIGEYTTDAAGMINIPTLIPDWYVVREIKAPNGYFLDETPRTVEVKSGAPTVITFTNKPLASLQIIKLNEATGGPLPGAVFSVEKQNGERVGEYTTDAGGVINIPYLDPGWYIVKETRAPSGFVLNSAPQTVEVRTGTPTIVTFVNTPLSSLIIKKIDEVTGAPLPGATFIIERQNGERVGEYRSDGQGLINIPRLQPGWYVVRETNAPLGYILDETPKTVEIKDGAPLEVTFTNKPLSGLQIKKIDSVTRQPLAGVLFAVSKFSGEKVGDFTTGPDGLIFISNMEPGYYTVTELRTIEGYHHDAEPRTVEIEWGKNTLLEVENVPISNLLIIKTDMQTRQPLEGVRFDVSKANGERVGTFTTDRNGRIYIDSLSAGRYHVVETEALFGYERDTRVYEVDMHDGRQTVLEVQNKPLGGLRIKKICAVTGEGIYNVEFMVFDHNNKVVGTFYSDHVGVVDFSAILVEGRYTIRETRAAAGYYLDEVPKTIEFVAGTVTEIIWENVPQLGQIQVTKLSANDNEINGLPARTPLEGAIFEVYHFRTGNMIDRFITGRDGRGVSNPLPLGRYIVKEVQAPPYYKINDQELDVYIEFPTQIIRLEYTNESANTGVYIRKTGNVEALAGDTIRYDIRAVQNTSTVPLTDFFWRDTIPTDAARLTRVVTGTYNQSLRYKILATTNKGDSRVVADNLSTTINNVIDLSNASLGLGSDEYITSFTLVFGNVRAGFTSVEQPQVFMTVLGNLPNGYEFANRVDIGGTYGGEWIISDSRWTTQVYNPNAPRLPRTGS